ncbi:hypothetical protein CVT24_011192 [Panaeolus cyanescens]|uniref:SHSP domain-containing protein n=1 Tax=Panaeolus cyanescens TaxID=181874 RepID=A0A409VIA7_9AGAR|nr:hypothetical protein CVT24_011192 [Panaeolus cyanescens]
MSKTPSSRRKITSVTDSSAFELYAHPTFVRAVNRTADVKILQAIRAGKLRPVIPLNNASGPLRYSPRMDLIDDPSSSKLTAIFEIPGIKTGDITLNIRDGCLVVQGQRRYPYPKNAQISTTSPPKEKEPMQIDEKTPLLASIQDEKMPIKVPVQELRYGTFHRSIRVPAGTKESDVSATLHEGMLTVTWPRSPAGASSIPAAANTAF